MTFQFPDFLSRLTSEVSEVKSQYGVLRYLDISSVLKNINSARVVSTFDKEKIENLIQSVDLTQKTADAMASLAKGNYYSFLANLMLMQERPGTYLISAALDGVMSATLALSKRGNALKGALLDVLASDHPDPEAINRAQAAYQEYVNTYAQAEATEQAFISSLPSRLPNF